MHFHKIVKIFIKPFRLIILCEDHTCIYGDKCDVRPRRRLPDESSGDETYVAIELCRCCVIFNVPCAI